MPEDYKDSSLYRIRHSTAHVMAQAMLERFPEAKIAIGPPIEDGFYYDFDLPRPITEEDLAWVEKRMKEIIRGGHAFQYARSDAPTKRARFVQRSAVQAGTDRRTGSGRCRRKRQADCRARR